MRIVSVHQIKANKNVITLREIGSCEGCKKTRFESDDEGECEFYSNEEGDTEEEDYEEAAYEEDDFESYINYTD